MPKTTLDFEGSVANPELSQLVSDENLGMLPGERFASLLGSILSVVMTFSAVLLLLYLVWGAMEWITSGGESGKLQAARNKMMHAVVGMLVLSSVLAIFMFVQYFLGISVLKFTFPGGGTHGSDAQPTYQCFQNATTCAQGTLSSNSSCGITCAQNAVCCLITN